MSPPTVSTNTGSGSHPFGIVVSPDGKSVYATDFTSNVVLQYDRSATTGALTFKTTPKIAAGSTPWGLTVSPDSKSVYVANQGASSVLQYDVNATTGALSPKTVASVPLGAGVFPVGIAVTPR
jgi:DNA-binding beta-propeller fold protein YncE